MGKIVMKNAVVKVNAATPAEPWTDLSNRAKSVRIRITTPTKDTTCFQDAWESSATGIPSWTASVTFLQDFAASNSDNSVENQLELSSMCSAASSWLFKADSAATSVLNPAFIGTAWVTDYEPISGSLGDVLGTTATLKGTGALVKYQS